MSERIDNLSIGITASAAQAVKAIDRVKASLDKLHSSSSKGKDDMEDVAGSTQKAGSAFTWLGEKLKAILSKFTLLHSKLKTTTSGTKKFWEALRNIKVGSGLKDLGTFFKNQLFGGIQSAISAANTLFSSLKRIAFYRAIRSAIKFITQGLKEGIENLYQWSATADGTFKKSMDSLATSALYLKNSFAAMVSPLIEAVAPAIDFVVDKVVGFFNTVNQVFAALTGKSTYTVAKKVATVWKEIEDDSKKTSTNTKKAADNAKKYVNTILAFDEINKLNGVNEPTTSASSSTPGDSEKGGGVDYSTMFETRKIDSGISDFVNKLKDAFNKGDWKGLGKLLGDKVNELVNKVDWAGLGKKVGYYINGWFSTKYWTLKTINFTNIGRSIATFLNNAIAQIDFNTIGRYFVRKLTAIADMIIGFFKTFDFGQLASAMSDFVIGMLKELTDWLGKTDWMDFGKTLADKLVDVLINIKWGEIASAFFGAMNAALMGGLHLLGGFFDELASRFKKELNWDKLSDNVKQNILDLMGLLGESALAVGAVLAFSGHIGLGIGIMAAGAGVLATKMAMNESVSEKIDKNMHEIMNIINELAIVVGVVLAFSGHIPLGLAIIAVNAGMLAHNNVGQEQWGAIKEKIDKVLNDSHGSLVAAGALMVIGSILVFTGVATAIGLALLLPGAALAAKHIINDDWGSVGNKIKGVINSIYEFISGESNALFVIGLVLALSGVATPLGLAIIAGNILWGAVEKLGGPQEIINKISEWWGNVMDWWSNLPSNALKIGLKMAVAVTTWWRETVVPWWQGLVDNSLKIGLKIGVAISTWWKDTVLPWWNGLDDKALKIGFVIGTSLITLFQNLKKEWDDAAYKLSITIVPKLSAGLEGVKEAAKAAGGKFVSGIKQWLGLPDDTSVDVSVNAVPGKGMENKYAGPSYMSPKVNQNNSTSVKVNAKVGSGMKAQYAGPSYMSPIVNQNNATNVKVNAKAGTGMKNTTGGVEVAKIPDANASVNLSVNNWSGFLNGISTTLHNWFPSVFAEGGIINHGKISRFRYGGVINAYAGGTSQTHGSLFLAGEAGPEIVGHVGGRTEVLNKSQIAATMYEAVRSAMTGVTIDANVYQGANDEGGNEAMLELIMEGNSATQREIDILREQNNILRQLLEKPVTAEISTNGIVNALSRKNKRDGTTVVPVMY